MLSIDFMYEESTKIIISFLNLAISFYARRLKDSFNAFIKYLLN